MDKLGLGANYRGLDTAKVGQMGKRLWLGLAFLFYAAFGFYRFLFTEAWELHGAFLWPFVA